MPRVVCARVVSDPTIANVRKLAMTNNGWGVLIFPDRSSMGEMAPKRASQTRNGKLTLTESPRNIAPNAHARGSCQQASARHREMEPGRAGGEFHHRCRYIRATLSRSPNSGRSKSLRVPDGRRQHERNRRLRCRACLTLSANLLAVHLC